MMMMTTMMMMKATRTTMTTTMMMMMAMIVTMAMMMLITTNNANMWSQEGSQKGKQKCELSVNLFGVGGGCLPFGNRVSLSVGIISTTVMTTITINSILRTVGF